MEYSKNPFTPTFGSVPPFLAGREHILRDINRGFINGPGDPNLSTIFTGARGTGKTALLSLLSETALEHGWIAANVSAMPGMLEDIIERTKEAADSYLSQPHARINGVQIGPVGIDWTYAQEAQGNWRTRMNGIFKQLEKHDIGLLITIDEVTVDLEEMLQFASVYQHFVREGKKVALLMAGLPYKVSALLRNDSVSFLRRSQYHQLGRITDVEIANAFRKTVEAVGRSITPEALEDAVKAVDGFPYMMQLVGYRTWDVSENSPQISASDVQQGSLGAFKQDRLTGLVEVVQGAGNVAHHRLDALGVRKGIGQRLLEVDRCLLEVFGQLEIVIGEVFLQLLGQFSGIEEILHADGTTGHLVFIGRADAATGRADLVGALGGFAGMVQRDVVRQDQRAAFGDLQAAAHIDTSGFQLVDFLQQRFGRQHDTVADVASHGRMQDTGRNQAQDGLLATDHQRVTGVVAALEAHDALRVVGQPIDDLALAFVTPLGADDDDVLCHFLLSL